MVTLGRAEYLTIVGTAVTTSASTGQTARCSNALIMVDLPTLNWPQKTTWICSAASRSLVSCRCWSRSVRPWLLAISRPASIAAMISLHPRSRDLPVAVSARTATGRVRTGAGRRSGSAAAARPAAGARLRSSGDAARLTGSGTADRLGLRRGRLGLRPGPARAPCRLGLRSGSGSGSDGLGLRLGRLRTLAARGQRPDPTTDGRRRLRGSRTGSSHWRK